jgi:hypothetical protein
MWGSARAAAPSVGSSPRPVDEILEELQLSIHIIHR